MIFEKYFLAQKAKAETRERQKTGFAEHGPKPGFFPGDLLFYTKENDTIFFIMGRGLVYITLLWWGCMFVVHPIASNYAGESILHYVNLPFHEAGHILFRPFGSFLTSLGGTLGQLLMPVICFATLLFRTRDTFGASVSLWWLGQNFFDISPYIDDARTLNLPLVGGNVGHSSPYGFHDWEYILTESGLLQYDHFIARLSVTIGTVLFLTAYVWGAILLVKQYQNRN